MTKEEQSKVDKYYADLKEYNNHWKTKIENFLGFLAKVGIFLFIVGGIIAISLDSYGVSRDILFPFVIIGVVGMALPWVAMIPFGITHTISLYYTTPEKPTIPQRQIVRYEKVTEYVSVWIEDTYHIGPRGGKYKVQDNGRGRVYVGDHVQSSGYWTSELRTYNKKIVEFENLIN